MKLIYLILILVLLLQLGHNSHSVFFILCFSSDTRISMDNYIYSSRSFHRLVESEDNIAHLIHSYHAIYDYMRDALQKYDYIVIDDKEDYHIIKKYLMILNRFLTKHQNNYERWYYKVKDDNAAYEMDIMMLQKQYRHYDELVADICSLNKQMNEFADYLGVDLKWYQELFSVNVE